MPDAKKATASVKSSTPKLVHRLIISSVTLLLLFLIAFSAWDSYTEQQAIIEAVELQSKSYARALKEHAERTLSEADLVLQTTTRQLEKPTKQQKLTRTQLEELLRFNIINVPQIGSLSVIDANGQMRATSLQHTGELPNIAIRHFFPFHRDNSSNALFINPPFKSKLTGKWRFTLTRRLTTPSGRFNGIVMIAIEIDYFEKLYRSVVNGKNGRFTLATTTGDYLVLVPSSEDVYSSGKKTAAFFRKMVDLTPEQTYHNPSSNIAKEYRIVSYNRLDKYPVVAIMSFGKEQALVKWRSSTIKRGGVVGLLVAVIIILTRLLLQQIKLLEHTVATRTSMLSVANLFLEKEIEDRKQIETDLRGYQHKMESMATELALTEDRERGRIAGELHDQVGQRLIYCKMQLDGLAAETTDSAALAATIKIKHLVEESLQDIRSLTFQLRPPILAGAGLAAALQWLVAELSRDYGLTVHSDTDQYDPTLKQPRYEIKSTLFQATRELLLNVIKHAGVSEASLSLHRQENLLSISVTDNGNGYASLQEPGTPTNQGGFGLYNLKQRLEYLGGKLVVESVPDAGTTATILLLLTENLLEE